MLYHFLPYYWLPFSLFPFPLEEKNGAVITLEELKTQIADAILHRTGELDEGIEAYIENKRKNAG